jgi:hypothetical protein
MLGWFTQASLVGGCRFGSWLNEALLAFKGFVLGEGEVL